MKRVSPEEFREAFLSSIRDAGEIFSVRYEAPFPDYTCFIREVILPDIAKRLGLFSYCRDYYTLDAVFFEEKDIEHFPPHTSYAKYIAVAVEHENLSGGTSVEMNKLQLFNAPLKVLISYEPVGGPTERLLLMYERIIRAADCFNDIATLRRQLVILGEPYSHGEWRFYAYGPLGFELL